MGQPKLLLSLGGEAVIARLLKTLTRGCTGRVLVVCRRDDDALAREVECGGGEVVQPEIDPADMRQSVEHGLRALASHAPRPGDGWLLCPADHPLVERKVLETVLAAWTAHPDRIVIPTWGDQRGHPVLWPWSMAEDVFALPPDVGLNRLVKQQAARVWTVPVETDSILADLDTPEDYAKWKSRLG